MGIPLFFKTLSDKYGNIIISQIENKSKNYLFLDLNCAIHPCCRNFLKTLETYDRKNENDYERKMINSVLRYIKKLVEFAQSDFIFISIDGVAPKAKMNQQRIRRFKSIIEKEEHNRIKADLNIPTTNTWDTNAISPGTRFMEKLSESIKTEINSNYYDNKHVIFSNANVPGEGEHKILKYVKENDISDGNVIIYGLDADLIMLSLVSQKDNCYLLREAVEFGVTDYDRLLYLSIDELRDSISCDFRERFYSIDPLFDTSPKFNKFNSYFINDYLFVCFLLGNDFMPHLPALSLRNNGLDILINAYLDTINTLEKPFIQKKKINIECLILLLRKLSLLEDTMAEKYYKKRKHFRGYNKEYEDEYDRRIDNLNNLPILDPHTKEIEKKINMGSQFWRQRYYSNTMNIRSQEDIDRVCSDYFKTLRWTFLYYFDECPSYDWSYNYSYGPSLLDLYNYIKNTKNFDINNIKFSKKLVPSPCVQLLAILPSESSNLLPVDYRWLFTEPNSPLLMYYPKKYDLEMLYKRYYWMCEPSLPNVEISYIKKVLDDIKIKKSSRFTRQKNYIKTSAS